MSKWEIEKKELKQQAIRFAISSWEDKLNGVYMYWETNRYSPEYCKKQITYFRNLT